MTIEEWLRYHQSDLHFAQRYRGLTMIKNPFDLVVYEEILWEIKPTVIIEIGNAFGGFALWLSDRMKMIGQECRIITIDLSTQGDTNLEHYKSDHFISIVGDCNDPNVIEKVGALITPEDVVFIIEDSSHTFDNTFNALENYKKFITPGSYFVIEDGICDVLNIEPCPGPMKAVEAWAPSNPEFAIDRSRERYIMTYNPKGYLKRLR